MTTKLKEPEAKLAVWNRRHLLDIEDLSKAELETILKRTEELREFSVLHKKKLHILNGKTVVNLFFEPSTRRRTSFSLAARRLGADTIDFSPSGSSISKGETFIDTAKNIEAMGIDAIVVRHSSPGPRCCSPRICRRTLSTPATAFTSIQRRACWIFLRSCIPWVAWKG